jgi:quinoprotein relay system zinc metallohydrolase 2
MGAALRRCVGPLVVAAALLTACAAPPDREAALALQELAPGVHLAAGRVEEWGPANDGRVANVGFVVGERCVAVIDSGGTLSHGRALVAALRRVTDRPVCYLINTHAHPDHVLGNEAFAPPEAGGPQIVGHRRLPAALAVRGPYYLRALQRDFDPADAAATLRPPTVTVDTSLVLDLGGRRLSLRAWPTAHTDADLSVFDETSGTLWLGDLLFTEHVPIVDGRLAGWLAVLDELRGWPVRTVVPGHGPPGRDWPAALAPQRRYLEQLQTDVKRALKEGRTMSEAVATIKPDRADWRLLEVYHDRNVTAVYAELEWDD